MNRRDSKHDFTCLSKIKQAVGIPLGIHGSPGFADDQLRRMIHFVAAKINYCEPQLEVAARRTRENTLSPDGGYTALVDGEREAIRIEAECCIRIWGCGGRSAEVLMQCRTWVPAAMGSERDPVKAGAAGSCCGEENTKTIFAGSRP